MPKIKGEKIRPFRSIAFTLASAFLALTLTVLVLISGLQTYFNFVTQQKIVTEQQDRIANEAAHTVSSFVQEKFSILEATAALVDLINVQEKEQKQTLEKLMGVEDSFRQLSLLDSREQELINISRLSSLVSGGLREKAGYSMFPRVSQGEIYISSVYIDKVTSEPLTIIAVPVKNVFGDIQGTLLAEVNLKFMWDLMDEIEVGQNGLAYVVDQKGYLIAFSDIGRVLKGENLIYLDEVKESVLGGEPIHKSTADMSKGIMGTRVITNHAHLKNPNWAVVVELPVAEAYNSLIRQLILSASTILLIFGLAIATVIYMSKRITRPIIRLRNAVTEIGKGNLYKEIKIETKDEIGELAETFNLMTAKLKKQREREEAVSKMKSEFVSITAHELRSPLSALKWTFDLIKDGTLGEFTKEQEEYLEHCRIANEKMIDTINDLLDLTRIEEGRFLYEYSEVKLEDLIQEVLDSLEVQMAKKKIAISFKKIFLPPLKIDAEKITIAIKNLLENSLRYTPEGGEIDIIIDRKPKEIIVKIRDTGIGIPKGQEQRIFEKFFRAKNALAFETSGSGLGLRPWAPSC